MSGGSEPRELAWLERLRDLSHRLAEEWELERLLPLVLDAAIELTRAERGYLVLVTGRTERGAWRFRVVQARGFDQAALRGAEGEFSRTVVRRVVEGAGEGVVTSRERELLDASSVQARGVVAIACVPLRLRGETRGVLYLDHRRDAAAFSPADLPMLRTFADQAALALSTAELLGERARNSQALDAALADLRAARAALQAHPGGAAPPQRARFGRLVGASPVMHALYEDLELAAASREPVLILGELGAGKQAVARELHARGEAAGPFTVVACALRGEELFAGPAAGRGPGAPLEAPGTVYLDELAELPLELQGRLLRALQTGVAGQGGPPLRARVLAASRHDLPARVQAGQLRADLHWRLDVQRLEVPPLRQRREDIPLLLEHFARQSGRRLSLTPRARELLLGYAWPGNVRQLEDEAMRLLQLSEPQLTPQHLSPEVRQGRGVTGAPEQLAGKTLDEVERTMIEAALRECRGNKARAARQLGIPRSTLYGLLVRYGLEG